MDSRLDSIFKASFRHAEALDTRQGIRRHDQPDERNRKKDDPKREDRQDLWEDQTTVSIRALKAFLRQLVHQTSAAEAGGAAPGLRPATQQEPDITPGGSGTAHHPPPASARAAQAYRRTHSVTHGAEDSALSAAPPDIALSPEERRTIHKLIGDLDRLERQNIEFLTIRKGESFLQSLVDSARALSANL